MLLTRAIEQLENEFNACLWIDETDTVYTAKNIEAAEGRRIDCEDAFEPHCELSDITIEGAKHDYTMLTGEVSESNRALLDVAQREVFDTDIVTCKCKEIAALIACADEVDVIGNAWILRALPFSPVGMTIDEVQDKCRDILSAVDFFGYVNQAAINWNGGIIAAEFSEATGHGFLHVFCTFGEWYRTEAGTQHGIPLNDQDVCEVLSQYAIEYAPREQTAD